MSESVTGSLSGCGWPKLMVRLNILVPQYPDSGKLGTDVPDVDTGIDWLVYLAQYSQQCQAQSRFVVRSRLDTVKNTEIMACPNQAFYAVLFDRTVVHLEPEYSQAPLWVSIYQ